MKTTKIFIAAIIFFAGISNSISQTSYSFNDGLNTAKSTGKKVFLSIYSNSDNWSKKMDSEVYSSASVKDALSNFVFVKIDAEATSKYTYGKKEYSAAEIAKLFGATGYPTFGVLNADGSIIKFKYNGEEVSIISGFIGEDDFVELLNYFSQEKYKDSDLSTIFQN